MMSDRPGREIPKEYREIVLYQIEHHGWRYNSSRKGHPLLYPADRSKRPLAVSTTPGDRAHGLTNFINKVRNAGGTWPPEGRQK